jgi:TRAP-type C4-dicarboxylate transport system substrate-binding protein
MNRVAALKIIGLGFLMFLFLVSAVNAASKTIKIKIATLAPEGSSWMQKFGAVGNEVEKKTNNEVRFKIYPGGVLGDEKDMLRKMHIGQIHGAALTSSGLSALFSEMDVFQIPFLFQSYGEVDYVIDKMDTFFKNGFEKKGYVLLGWTEGGFVRLMSTQPVSTLSELKKLKVWTWEDSPMTKVIFDEAQVSAIPLSVPDVLVGLQTGLVDVVYAPPSGAIAMQWFTKIKYITDVPLIYLVGGVVLRKNVFKKLSPAYQEVLLESCQKNMAELKGVVRTENQEALTVMQKHGVKILKPTKEEVGEFKRVADRGIQRLEGSSFSKKVKDEVITLLKEYHQVKNQ